MSVTIDFTAQRCMGRSVSLNDCWLHRRQWQLSRKKRRPFTTYVLWTNKHASSVNLVSLVPETSVKWINRSQALCSSLGTKWSMTSFTSSDAQQQRSPTASNRWTKSVPHHCGPETQKLSNEQSFYFWKVVKSDLGSEDCVGCLTVLWNCWQAMYIKITEVEWTVIQRIPFNFMKSIDYWASML